MFDLHPKLKEDTLPVGNFTLSRVLLMNNAFFPWVILVPEYDNLVELDDLSLADRIVLMDEMTQTARLMKELFSADKINIAALGNMVPQLHVHVIARQTTDACWPSPVWGAEKPSKLYSEQEAAARIAALQEIFSRLSSFVPAVEQNLAMAD